MGGGALNSRLSTQLQGDHHTHTARCGHAEGDAADYVEAALAAGLSAIALTDHLPMYWLPEGQRDPHLAMGLAELPQYVDEVLALQERYQEHIQVRLGIEADYIPGHEEGLRRLLEPYPFELVLGSVHWLDGWMVDGLCSIPRFQQGSDEVDRIWAAYAETLIRAARSGLFDILTHLDLPKKFGFRPSVPFAGRQAGVVAAVVDSGCAVELSSGGLRKPVGEAYPAPDLLAALVAAGVAVVLSSDAHSPGEVGYRFGELRAFLGSVQVGSR